MVTTSESVSAGVAAIAPLPPLTTADELLADALPLLDPPSRISVTDAAERSIRVAVAGVWQGFDRRTVPYTVEPADITQSRRFTAVCFVGPSQSGKSEMLKSVALHAPLHEPSPIQVIHMTKTDAEAWVEEKLDPTIRNSPALSELLGRGRDDSTFSRKRFRGMRLSIGYPTASQLSSRTQRMVLLTDYDHMPQRLGPKDRPEGSPFVMARRRVQTYRSRGCVLVESTPAHPIADGRWRQPPEEPHSFPPVTGGICAIYNEGTRGRWYWECPDCAEMFEPRIDRLVYDATLPPGEAGAAAEMGCPHCGALIAHRHKAELNRAGLAGRGGWLHEAADGALVRIGDAALRETTVASYALNGAAAVFSSWSELVADLVRERRVADAMGDDTELGAVHYTQIGVPYLPRSAAGTEGEIGAEFLRNHASELERGTCPSWTRFVTVAVDVQATRFPVMVMAWGERGERAIVDRFDLATPPVGAPDAATRALDPARYDEDWQVLLPLGDRVWPVAGGGFGLRAAAIGVDFQGQPGVSDRAETFWRARRAEGQARRWYLTRGWGGTRLARRIWYEAPERGSKGKRARGIKLLNIATDRLKDSVAAALARTADGAGRQHTPGWMDDAGLAELVAEERTPKGWRKRRGVVRNENQDLSVANLALAEKLGLPRVDWDDPPGWAVSGLTNDFAEPDGTGEAPDAGGPDADVPRKPPRRRIRYLSRS